MFAIRGKRNDSAASLRLIWGGGGGAEPAREQGFSSPIIKPGLTGLAVLAVLAIFFAAVAPAEALGASPGQAMGLLDCLARARVENGRLKKSLYQKEWSQARLDHSRWSLFPQLGLELRHEPKTDFFGNPLETEDTYFTELQFSQPLYSPAISLDLAQAEQGKKTLDAAWGKEALEVAQEIVPAYYQLRAARKIFRMRNELLAKGGLVVEAARQGAALGVLRRGELLAAKARLAEFAYQASKARGDALSASMRIKGLMGYPRFFELRLKPEILAYRLPASYDQALQNALRRNASLLHGLAQEKYYRLGMEAAQAQNMSVFKLVGRYTWEGIEYPGDERDYGVMVVWEHQFGWGKASASFDYQHLFRNLDALFVNPADLKRKAIKLSLFDGNRSRVEIASAKLERLRAREDAAELRRKLEVELMTLWQEQQQKRSLLAWAQQEGELQAERLAVVQARLQVGAASPLEALERQWDLVEARIKCVNAESELERSLALFCLLCGDNLKMEARP